MSKILTNISSTFSSLSNCSLNSGKLHSIPINFCVKRFIMLSEDLRSGSKYVDIFCDVNKRRFSISFSAKTSSDATACKIIIKKFIYFLFFIKELF